MSKVNALVGIAKCPNTHKLYGVRIEVNNNVWTATWAFPIKEEAVKHEGYKEQQFPPDLRYAPNYSGCPYCHKKEDLAAISKHLGEQNKANNKPLTIAVTTVGTDNIGKILTSLNIPFEHYNKIHYNCDLFFINCNTKDKINPDELREYVKNGGIVYASDFAIDFIYPAFKDSITYGGKCGVKGEMDALVVDDELRSIVGETIRIYFDLGNWAVINATKGKPLLLGGYKSQYHGRPIMFKLEYGKGVVFFTCFHNHAQASEQEQALLQLLVLKQISARKGKTIEETSNELGVDIDAIKSKFTSNF